MLTYISHVTGLTCSHVLLRVFEPMPWCGMGLLLASTPLNTFDSSIIHDQSRSKGARALTLHKATMADQSNTQPGAGRKNKSPQQSLTAQKSRQSPTASIGASPAQHGSMPSKKTSPPSGGGAGEFGEYPFQLGLKGCTKQTCLAGPPFCHKTVSQSGRSFLACPISTVIEPLAKVKLWLQARFVGEGRIGRIHFGSPAIVRTPLAQARPKSSCGSFCLRLGSLGLVCSGSPKASASMLGATCPW